MKASLAVLVITVATVTATATPADIDAIEITKDVSARSQPSLRAVGNRRKLASNKSKQNSSSKKAEPSNEPNKDTANKEPNNEPDKESYKEPSNESKSEPTYVPNNEPKTEPSNEMLGSDEEYGDSDSPADMLRAKKIAAANKAVAMADEAKKAAQEAADMADEAKTAADKAAMWIMRTLAPNTSASISSPNASPVMAPAVVLSGDATSGFFIEAAPEATIEDETQSLSPCPPLYDASETYAAWDTVNLSSEVFMCRPPPYEAYCNIISIESLDADEKDLWENAWDFIENCAPAAETSAQITVTPEPTPAPTPSPTVKVQQGLPNCPPAYDWTKTTYVAGEEVEIKEHIFQCNTGEGYEFYCNQAGWDGALLEQNDNARQMWNDAWVGTGPCDPISVEEVMEDRLVNGN